MKLSTTQLFQHSLIAPKGKIFVDDPIEMAKIFDRDYTISMNGRLLRWTEQHFSTSSCITNDKWDLIMTNVLRDSVVETHVTPSDFEIIVSSLVTDAKKQYFIQKAFVKLGYTCYEVVSTSRNCVNYYSNIPMGVVAQCTDTHTFSEFMQLANMPESITSVADLRNGDIITHAGQNDGERYVVTDAEGLYFNGVRHVYALPKGKYEGGKWVKDFKFVQWANRAI